MKQSIPLPLRPVKPVIDRFASAASAEMLSFVEIEMLRRTARETDEYARKAFAKESS